MLFRIPVQLHAPFPGFRRGDARKHWFELTILRLTIQSPAILTDCRAFFLAAVHANCRAGPWRQKSAAAIALQTGRLLKSSAGTFSAKGNPLRWGCGKKRPVFRAVFSLCRGQGILAHGYTVRRAAAYHGAKEACSMLTNDSFETLTVSPAYPGHLLTIGSNSSEVARIQTYLNALRVDDPNIPTLTVDGKFGQNTKIAVQVFQYTHSLAADGIVGGATWNAIIAAYNARFSGSADTFPWHHASPGRTQPGRGPHADVSERPFRFVHRHQQPNRRFRLWPEHVRRCAPVPAAVQRCSRRPGGQKHLAKIVDVHNAMQQGAPTRVSPAYAGTALAHGLFR